MRPERGTIDNGTLRLELIFTEGGNSPEISSRLHLEDLSNKTILRSHH